jgi:alpha-glucosidase
VKNWWRDAVIYQIYPRSFGDSNGDGIGDLNGIVEHLDHLAWLGIDTIWLNPVMVSPNTDFGYDVADYCDINPEYGTLDDFDRLVKEADARGIRILNDLVPNHTSDQHAWFTDARRSKDAEFRDYYVWADPKPDGSPPNNWLSEFGGDAWTLDETTGQYYLHLFLPTQPDLNWWSDAVKTAFDDILRFWFERGVAGFRLDVCHAIVKDRELRDNPPATDEDSPNERVFGQRRVYSANRPEVHDVMKRWRKIAKSFDPERLLLGETYVWGLDQLTAFYGKRNDEIQLAFNIPFVNARFDASLMSGIVDKVKELFPAHAWPVWTGSNHDAKRLATRWCEGDERKIRCALMMLLTLRGTPVLYYGDEIGLRDVDLKQEELRDPVGIRFWPAYPGRDGGRTPMQWSAERGAGFTSAPAKSWLPIGDADTCNVEAQRGDEGSVLHLTRDLIALRKAFASAPYTRRSSPENTWVYKRGTHVIALNMSDEPVKIARIRGTIAISTTRERDGQSFAGGLSLDGWEGVVVDAS